MLELINRLWIAFRLTVLWRRTLTIEVKYSRKKKKDQITLWGWNNDTEQQIYILRQLADSMEADLKTQKLKKSLNLPAQNR